MSFQFNLQVLNQTGFDIYAVSMIHYCNDNTNGQVFQKIPNGQAQPVGTVTTFSEHKDYYGGQFIMNGDFYQFNCYCSADDGDTGCTLQLSASSYTVQYDVNGKASDSCSNKSYDYTTN